MLAVPATLATMTIVGRLWSKTYPVGTQADARFYLSPALGLATIVLVAGGLGRYIPLGDTILTPFIVLVLFLSALRVEYVRSGLLRHLFFVACFGLVCGTCVLVPLYLYGAINTHNDTFTYLAHSDWLQHHAFGQQISEADATPASTQIRLYQMNGLRMGASYLLAFFQALLNFRWAYDAYPAVIISAISACCLAIGFPIAALLAKLPLMLRLALLAIPSFSLGGLVFGGNFGFLPQTVGLTASAAALFTLGAVVNAIGSRQLANDSTVITSLPIAAAVSAVICAYSEVTPFLAVAFLLSGVWIAVVTREWRKVLVFGCSVALLVAIMTNLELLRAYHSLRAQAGAVVGGAVPWSLAGFLGHAVGVRAGVWDSDLFSPMASIWSALFLLLILFGFRRASWADVKAPMALMLPALLMLGVLFSALLYFRYFIISPFPTGIGQSWSQFKLSEWAHPFCSMVVLAVAASCRGRFSRSYTGLMGVLIIVACIGAGGIGLLRMRGIVDYYSGTKDLRGFYHEFRSAVFETCPLNSPIYLSLGYQDHKFRQMAAVFLADRLVRSNWEHDDYIRNSLPGSDVHRSPEEGDCLVRQSNTSEAVSSSVTIGRFQIERFTRTDRFEILSVLGGHGYEAEWKNWWQWVERSIAFTFSPADIRSSRAELHFEYAVRSDASLKVNVVDDAGILPPVDFELTDQKGVFSHSFPIGPKATLRISITTAGDAPRLSKSDERRASFRIGNLTVKPVRD
ncbi:MAG: hypothetical protein NT113_12915 [Hyphomicrobiales bacterium]|nr:hypothetical protein [Hyphomicrobiales bacterium]